MSTAVRGRILFWRSDGFYVTYEHQTVALRADSLVPWCSETLTDAIAQRLPVLLVFEEGDPLRPIIAGAQQPPPAPGSSAAEATVTEVAEVAVTEVEVAGETAAANRARSACVRAAEGVLPSGASDASLLEGGSPGPLREARVDGQRIEFTAQDEVVLRCGEASITLRRNGRILIQGAYVESRARGTHRIKGGHVLIN